MKKYYPLFAGAFFFVLGGTVLGFSLIYGLTDWFSFNPAQIGSFMALGQVAFFLGCTLYHKLGSHVHPIKTFSVSSALVFIAALLLSLVRFQYVTYAAYWMIMLSTGFFWPPVTAWFTGGLDNLELNRTLSVYNRSWMAANIIGPLIAGNLYRWNSGAPLILANLSYLMVCVCIAVVRHQQKPKVALPLKPGTGEAGPTPIEEEKPEIIRELDKKLDSYRYRAWVGVFGSAMFLGALLNIMPLHIRDGLGYSESTAGIILFFRCVASFGSFTILAKFSSWHFKGYWFILVQSSLLVTALLLLIAGNSLPIIAIIVVLFGFFDALSYNNSIFYSGATGKSSKKNMAVQEIIIGSGLASGTAMGGFLYQHFSISGMGLGLILFLSAILTIFIIIARKEKASAPRSSPASS
ncbi:MAG: MFS transporter [Treponema sp.]|nr:MFS transporter [Treponema sp.]